MKWVSPMLLGAPGILYVLFLIHNVMYAQRKLTSAYTLRRMMLLGKTCAACSFLPVWWAHTGDVSLLSVHRVITVTIIKSLEGETTNRF